MPRPKRYNASQRTSTTIIDDGGSAPANVLLKLRESTSAADLSKLPAPQLDPFGLAPDLSLRVAGFADAFNAAHAEDSLVRSLLQRYAAAASQVCGDAAATTELRRGAILRVVDLLKHDKRLMRAFLDLLPPASRVVTPRSSEESAFATI